MYKDGKTIARTVAGAEIKEGDDHQVEGFDQPKPTVLLEDYSKMHD